MRQQVFFVFICYIIAGNVQCAERTTSRGAQPPGIRPARDEDLDPALDATCKIALTGKNGKCRRGYCLNTELSIDGGRNDVYCMCSKDQFLTASGCNNKLTRRRSQAQRKKRQVSRTTRKLSRKTNRKNARSSQSGDIEVLRGQQFTYPKRNLLGLYLTVSMSECISLCRSFEAHKKNRTNFDRCGSVVVHQHESKRFVCEVVSSKPVKRCKRLLQEKRSYSTAFLKPLLKNQAICR
uniref:Secreted protein n=1 Tax=Plectus sambesii TaxID=2011161 RepID=A0A914VWJ4_9BILA